MSQEAMRVVMQAPEVYRGERVEMHRCLNREWVFAPMGCTIGMRRIVIYA
jgi:hypothetical protein